MGLFRAIKRRMVAIVIICLVSIVIYSMMTTRGELLVRNMVGPRWNVNMMANTVQVTSSTNNEHTVNAIQANLSDSIHKKSTGYERAAFLRQACMGMKTQKSERKVRVSYDPIHNVLYCPLCKIASTFWTRVFQMVKRNSDGVSPRLTSPFDVPISNAPRSNLYYDKSTGHVSAIGDASDAFKFLVVRNPFSLLYSAYVDKIVGPNPQFWGGIGRPAVLNDGHRSKVCGSDVTFDQFVRYIVKVHHLHQPIDCHVGHFDTCQPCEMNYTYVVTIETIKEDTLQILKRLNQTETLAEFETKFSDLHAYDGIDDSVSGPFSWKSQITRCMPWHEALQRIWRKLQMRGIIANSEEFPLTSQESDAISRGEFINVLLAARQRSAGTDFHNQKQDEYLQTFRQVSVDTLDEIRSLYAEEFKLFGYDDRPKELFDRDE